MPRQLAISALLALGLPLSVHGMDLAPLKGTGATLHWEAPQFIQADAHGNVFLLRGDTLEVYPVGRSHELGEPARLQAGGVSGSLHDAALSRQGDWLLILGREVHRVAGGEDKLLPRVPWVPISVGFLQGDPIVGVTPPRVADADDAGDHGAPPLLMRAAGDHWSAELRQGSRDPGERYDLNRELAGRAVQVLDQQGGRYLVAREYAYRIELRRRGREAAVEELRLGKGEPVLRDAAASGRRLAEQAKAEGMETTGMVGNAFRGVRTIFALVEGEGHIYALVAPDAESTTCALDRIDWEARRVERLALSLPCPGRVSMAAGRDGLYFAEYDGGSGRFFASWGSLDAARWARVKEAEFTP